MRVTFRSGGLELSGDLRIPDGARPESGWPAVVLTGPLSGVKEQVAALYAAMLTRHGLATLAFDHRCFGQSEGKPRQHEDPQGKLEDLRDAVSYLEARDDIDASRIGCCGICLGGGYALRFAAFDPRVRAVACIASGFNSPFAMRDAMGADGYRSFLGSLAEVARREQQTGSVEYLPAVDGDGGEALMSGQEPWEYYGTERGASPHWENRMTRLSMRNLVTTDLLCGADFISPTPLLIVHGTSDDYCSPALAQQAFDRAGEPKQIVWLETSNHIDLYDNPHYVRPAVEKVAAFFGQRL